MPDTTDTSWKKTLRAEVGFGCPIPGCGSPFLEYHHFDPPQAVEEHHRTDGMLAICPTHHSQAAALDIQQCRELKQSAQGVNPQQLLWTKKKVHAVMGGLSSFEDACALAINWNPVVWFTRDETGRFLLNLRMPTLGSEPRAEINENFVEFAGKPEDIRFTAQARYIKMEYPNGDFVSLDFQEESPDTLLVDIGLRVGGTNINFDPDKHTTRFGGIEVSPGGMTTGGSAVGMALSCPMQMNFGSLAPSVWDLRKALFNTKVP